MKRFKHLLVAVNPNWLTGADGGVLLGELRSMLDGVSRVVETSDGDVTLISVLPEGSDERAVAAVERLLREKVSPLLPGGDPAIVVAQGRRFYEIVRQARRGGHDLVALSAQHPASGAPIVGTTATQVIRKCPCPVWVAGRAQKPVGPRTVLSAIGFHDTAPEILELSASLVALRGGEWHVLHVPEYVHEGAMRLRGAPADEIQAYEKACRDEAFARLHELVDPLAEASGVTPRLWMAEGLPHEQIAEAERKLGVDLVVMGTVGRGGLAGLLIGNTAERTLALIESSILAVKPPGFVCPIPA